MIDVQKIDNDIDERMKYFDRYPKTSYECLLILMSGYAIPLRHVAFYSKYNMMFQRSAQDFVSDLELWHIENIV